MKRVRAVPNGIRRCPKCGRRLGVVKCRCAKIKRLTFDRWANGNQFRSFNSDDD